ncbi:MAG: DUF378 domain-containing protein [Candidatus Liptonbacteria bacterium]|nr:DUF378 domain-containing protein [Candidatus Liptonbacteria bacterium]
MKGLHTAAFILLIIGGLNWLLVGVGVGDVVAKVLASWPVVAQVVYVLVGLAAIFEIATHKNSCKACPTGNSSM